MNVFQNQQKTGYEEMVSYGPRFYPQIKEMDAIYRFAGWTVDQMAADLETLIGKQFVMNMDAVQLMFYEQLFQLPVEGLSLEERRKQVYSYIYGNGKLSASKIAAFVTVLYGEDSVTAITMEEGLEICILTAGLTDAAHQQLVSYLNRVLPAHISYDIIYENFMTGNIYTGALWHDTEILEVRQVVL